jgi:phage-related protein
MSESDKPLAWLHGEVKSPPLSLSARIEVGVLLRRLQKGEVLSLPVSRPMPTIGVRSHELRVTDIERKKEWRVIYYVGREAIVILEVFAKTTRATPRPVLENCKRRLTRYQKESGEIS